MSYVFIRGKAFQGYDVSKGYDSPKRRMRGGIGFACLTAHSFFEENFEGTTKFIQRNTLQRS
jgi:hypothetical protein